MPFIPTTTEAILDSEPNHLYITPSIDFSPAKSKAKAPIVPAALMTKAPESSKPTPTGVGGTEFDHENYKRALMAWEESHGFITRYAAKQQDSRLLSVNDGDYQHIIATWRLEQQTKIITAGGAISGASPGNGGVMPGQGDGNGKDMHEAVEQKLKEKRRRPVLRRFGTFKKKLHQLVKS